MPNTTNKRLNIALVHDYLNEFGGAEVVLKKLSEIFPDAPIYTAFAVPGSTAQKAFADKKIITSWMQEVPFYYRLYSPLRFLIPWVWAGFDFSGFDLIITSASWYVTKGLGKKFGVKEICYCHTPPRWLYGYETSVNWQKYWPVKVYALIIGHFLRLYDFRQAQKVNVFLANSENVRQRIWKFYKRKAEVVYPPVKMPNSLPRIEKKEEDYFLIVSRIVGGKGIEMAINCALKHGYNLKIAGEMAGYADNIIMQAKPALYEQKSNIQFLGRVSDEKKYKLMAGAMAFLALAKDEDFGITAVEAQACGTPVIAYNGGGYRESVIDGKTGVLFDGYSADGLHKAIVRFNKLKWDKKVIKNNARRFDDSIFEQQIKKYAGIA